MPVTDVLLDNPILMKHVRTRLRPRQFAPWAIIVVITCLGIVWASQAFGGIANGAGLACLMFLQAIVLAFIGASQVGGSVGGIRESGIIDFHRVSPLPPHWMTVGFFLGAPIREYALFALTLPFAFLLAALGLPGVLGWIEMSVPLVLFAWLLHGLAMVSNLVSRKPKGTKGTSGVIVVLGLMFGGPLGNLFWYAPRFLQGTDGTVQFFGVRIYWMLVTLLYVFCALAFIFIASTRKFRSERMHAFSKPQAVCAMAVVTALVLGAAWNFQGQGPVVLVVLYVLVVAGAFLTITMTPGQVTYLRGVRRALSQGRRRPSAWADAGANRVALFIICALVFGGALASWELIAGDTDPSMYSQTIAVGVLTVAYFGLGLQYFLLRLAKSGGSVLTAFLFLVWVLPVILGSISFGFGTNMSLYRSVLCVSPITGIAMSSGLVANDAGAQSYKLIALAPAVTFAFVFNFLLETMLRRIDRDMRRSVKIKEAPGPFDYLDARPGQNGDPLESPLEPDGLRSRL